MQLVSCAGFPDDGPMPSSDDVATDRPSWENATSLNADLRDQVIAGPRGRRVADVVTVMRSATATAKVPPSGLTSTALEPSLRHQRAFGSRPPGGRNRRRRYGPVGHLAWQRRAGPRPGSAPTGRSPRIRTLNTGSETRRPVPTMVVPDRGHSVAGHVLPQHRDHPAAIAAERPRPGRPYRCTGWPGSPGFLLAGSATACPLGCRRAGAAGRRGGGGRRRRAARCPGARRSRSME